MNTREAIPYMTTANWLMGYADSLDEDRHRALIKKLNDAAKLLLAVWEIALNEEDK